MRVYDYDDWIKRPRGNARLIARLAGSQKLPRRKPRDPIESRLLVRSALESMRRREAEGRLVKLGPRMYELRSAADVRKERQE